jgi:hypothetical protein
LKILEWTLRSSFRLAQDKWFTKSLGTWHS